MPGLLIGALHFGHLPCVFVPAGPMTSGLPNNEKAKVREQYAQGQVGRDALLRGRDRRPTTAPGTCTFYGTANSNQMLLEAMGLHVPGAAFVNPNTPLREALTREAVRTRAGASCQGSGSFTPIGRLVDERAIVNAMVALLATGGSTNHLIHWVAVARAAGIVDRLERLRRPVARRCRCWRGSIPNGIADVNQFQAAGGPGFVIRELLEAGLPARRRAHRRRRRPAPTTRASRSSATAAARLARAAARPAATTTIVRARRRAVQRRPAA